MNGLAEPTAPLGGGPQARELRVLLLIPSYAKQGIEGAVATDRHPTMDYRALQAELGADLADYASVERDRHPAVTMARRTSRDVALALHGFLLRRTYDVIFCNGENVGIPLAAMLRPLMRRPGHVLIGHRLSPRKKRPFVRCLHGAMDGILVYAATQREYALRVLRIPESKVHLIPFHADHRFYRPDAACTGESGCRPMISSAGLEWRDYPTLLAAVEGLEVDVRLAAASPWSHHRNETVGRTLPANVTARRYEYAELRDLYAQSRFVVVPLYENDFQAGVTTILEAMSMGKAVVATRTTGQRDVIADGINGVYVPPGDPASLRSAVSDLLGDQSKCMALGARARRTIEERMTLDHWVSRVAGVIRSAAARGRAAGKCAAA